VRGSPTAYDLRMVRPESWISPAGESPVWVGTGAPSSRPRFVGEIWRAERAVKSLLPGSKITGRRESELCSLLRPAHLLARMSRRLWQERRIVRYYLHRWPSQWAMARARQRIKFFTGRSRVGAQLQDLVKALNLFLRRWGNYFRTWNASIKFVRLDRYVGVAAATLADQEAGPQPARRSGGQVDVGLVPRPGPGPALGRYPLPEGCVTMHRRPSVSRVWENRMHGLKGGWGIRAATRPLRP
jgi:hypothetical protein